MKIWDSRIHIHHTTVLAKNFIPTSTYYNTVHALWCHDVYCHKSTLLCIITNNCKLLQLLDRCNVFMKIAVHLRTFLHQKTKTHKLEARHLVAICVWSAQVLLIFKLLDHPLDIGFHNLRWMKIAFTKNNYKVWGRQNFWYLFSALDLKFRPLVPQGTWMFIFQ